MLFLAYTQALASYFVFNINPLCISRLEKLCEFPVLKNCANSLFIKQKLNGYKTQKKGLKGGKVDQNGHILGTSFENDINDTIDKDNQEWNSKGFRWSSSSASGSGSSFSSSFNASVCFKCFNSCFVSSFSF